MSNLIPNAISYNGNIISEQQIPYYQFSKCMIYGGGIMETLLAKKNELAYMDRHYQRLIHSLKMLYPKTPLNFEQQILIKHIKQLLAKKTLKNLSRITLKFFLDNHHPKFHYLIEVSPHQKRSSGVIIEKEDLTLDCSYRKHKLTPYTTSYLSGTLKNNKILRDHLVYNKKGKIIESAKANIGLVSQKILYLVSDEENILGGITQKIVEENYHRWFKQLKLTDGFTINDVKKADEILYLNSLSMCLSIEKLKGWSFQTKFSPIINEFLFDW